MKLQIAQGKEDQILVNKLEWVDMEDPTFESESPQVAIATFVNPKAVSYNFTGELYLGKVVGTKTVTSGVVSFTLAAGATKPVNFSVTMMRLTIPSETFPVFLEVKLAGVVICTFIGAEVTVIVTPAINVTSIVWQ